MAGRSCASLGLLAGIILIGGVFSPVALGHGQPLQTLGGRGVNVNGQVREAHDATAWVRTPEGRRVVARLELWVGTDAVALLPDGRLLLVPQSQLQPTDLRFNPASRQEVGDTMVADNFEGFRVVTTRNHVYIHDCSDEFLEVTKGLIETVHDAVYGYFQQAGFPVRNPETPMVVIVFKRQEDLIRWAELPPEVLAYYDGVQNHIYVFEEFADVAVAPKAKQELVFSTVAHEGVHQTLHNIGIQSRLCRWPAWLSEGLPEYFEAAVKQARWQGVGAINDFRHQQLRALITSRPRATGQFVQQTVIAPRLSSDGYAAAWALTHYLATHQRDAFLRYVRQVSNRRPTRATLWQLEPDDLKADLDEFKQFFGSNLRTLEDRMLTHLGRLRSRDPAANDKHYVVTCEYLEGSQVRRQAGMSVDADTAREYHQQVLSELSPRQRSSAKFRLMEFPSKREAERYAQNWLGTQQPSRPAGRSVSTPGRSR